MSKKESSEQEQALLNELSSLRQENQDLHGINAKLRQQVAVAHLETNVVARREQHLTTRLTQFQHDIDTLQASVSWRVTAPLRWARRRYVALAGTLPRTSALTPSTKGVTRTGQRESIGVFVHLYYEDLATELAAYIQRVPTPRRIYLSTDSSDKAQRIGQALAVAGLEADTTIRVFPNRGFDIGPFLVGFAEEIKQHALIVRLHGKKSSQLGDIAGTAWRRMLLDSLLGNTSRIQAILAAFKHFPDLGMICPEHWDGLYQLYETPITIGSNLVKMAKLLGRYEVPLAANTPIDFPSGSMFWCRSQALEPWLRFGFSWESFEESHNEARDASLAHALERSFFFGCELEGLTWARANALPGSTNHRSLDATVWRKDGDEH